MCKYVLIALVVVLVLLMAGAALVVQHYGWPGFLALLAALVVLAVVLRKALPPVFMYLITRPMRQLGAALRGARIVVHSVTPCEPPPPEVWEQDGADDSDDAGRRIADRRDRDDADENEDVEEDEAEDDETDEDQAAGRVDWYQIELTVVPPDAGSSEGRMVTRQAWSPQHIGAVGPRPPIRSSNPFRGWALADQYSGSVQHTPADLWTGSEYDSPDDQVFGEQRLRLRVGVARDVRAVTITYAHFTEIGEVPLPRMDVSAERNS